MCQDMQKMWSDNDKPPWMEWATNPRLAIEDTQHAAPPPSAKSLKYVEQACTNFNTVVQSIKKSSAILTNMSSLKPAVKDVFTKQISAAMDAVHEANANVVPPLEQNSLPRLGQ